MAINLTDELNASTKKGKIASAKQVYLEGDQENLQTVGERTHQLENTIKDISASGGASTANAVSYENSGSGLTAINAQAAIDELASKKADATATTEELAKKFDKENIAQELGDSEDKVVSQYALPFREIDNPEFLHCIVDAEDHFLFGIREDGSVEWQVGIPSPIKSKLDEIVNQSQQDNTDLTDALNSAKEELSASIANLQETKVDKEDGKSLIEDEVKNCFSVIENEEWLHAVVDADEHLLFGIKRETGKPYFPMNDTYHIITNDEWLAAWLDAEDKVIMGIKEDGYVYMLGENVIKKLNEVYLSVEALKELTSCFSQVENDEYLEVTTDAEGKVLAATYNDGSHYLHNVKSETIPTEFEHIDDPEDRLEVTTDAEGKVLAERLPDGERHEVKMNIDTLKVSNLNLQGSSVQHIEDALKANGFNVNTPIDWSESSFIQIPEPRFAMANITGITAMPTTKTQDLHAWMEFWDMQGNYFKKRVILNAQGDSSMGMPKKNAAIDICNDEWIGDDTAKVRFGNWVPQDSFHLKAYYTDFFRGVGVVSYKFYEQVVKTRGNMYDKPWKKALIDMDSIGVTTKSLGNPLVGQLDLQTDTGALCHPDGFPMALYLNGEFYGIFSWQLKKHRDNYHMDKSTAEHVHLDGRIYTDTVFVGKENIDWSKFEIRNPKGLYAIGGNKYDADIAQEEIAGEDEINAWIADGKLPDSTTITSKIKKNLQMTAKVKKYIQELADAMPAINEALNTYHASSKTDEDLQTLKKVFETYFDKDNQVDYLVVSDIIKNIDGFVKNWQWITYDGKKWWVCIYDLDMTFGGHSTGCEITDVLTDHIPTSKNPIYVIKNYYKEDLVARYKEIADMGIATADNIFSLLKDWTMRIGTDFYDAEYKKWADSPCIGDSEVRSDYWEVVTDEQGNIQTDTVETFDATQAYNVDDIVSFGRNATMGYFKFKCIKQTTALASNTPHTISAFSPIMRFRHNDNLYRIQKWIKKNVENMNKLYSYNQ